jgi:hypothetical protein
VPACPHGPPVAGVERLDRVRTTDDLPDFDVVVQELRWTPPTRPAIG